MKHSLVLLAIVILSWQSGVHAQPVGSYEKDFLIGTWSFGYPELPDSGPLVTAMDEAGANAMYIAPANLYGGLAGRTGYQSFSLGSWIGPGKDNADYISTDVRYFLASDAGDRKNPEVHGQTAPLKPFSYDLLRSWSTVLGGPVGKEWKIAKAQLPSSSTGILLEGLQVDQNTLSNPDGYIVSPNSPTIICDFIFRIDLSDYSGDPDIYTIEYYVKRSNGSSTTTALEFTQTIKPSTYTSLTSSANPHWATEHERIRTYQEEIYASLRTTINRVTLGGTAISIECKLRRTEFSENIYIRGLRIRSEMADKLLRGEEDANLSSRFNEIKNEIDVTNGAWAKTQAISYGTEWFHPAFRSFAYIDQKWKSFSGGKRIMTFLADFNNFYWFNAIYRDESRDKVVPPYFISECVASFNIFDDAQKEDITNPIDPKANHPIGYPSDVIPSSRRNVSGFTLFGFPVQDYETYSKMWEYRFGQCTKANEALASKGPNGTEPSPWVAGIWSLMSFRTPNVDVSQNPGWSETPELANVLNYSRFRRQGTQLDELYFGESISLRQSLINRLKQNPPCLPYGQPSIDGIFDLRQLVNIDPLTSSNLDMGTTWNVGDPTVITSLSNLYPRKVITLKDNSTQTIEYRTNSSQWRLDNRAMLGTELRMEAWDAISHGTKGIFWNTFSNDGGENVGVTNYGYIHDHDWWDDGAGLASGQKRAFLSNFKLGSNTTPLVPADRWEKFKVQKQKYDGTQWGLYDPILFCCSDWISKDLNNNAWNGYTNMASDMSSLFSTSLPWEIGSSTDNLIQDIVDKYANAKLDISGGTYRYRNTGDPVSGDIRWVPESHDGQLWGGFMQGTSCDYWDSFHWANNTSANFFAWAPTFYGFKERFSGVMKFAKDVKPLASLLPKLEWVAAIENTGELMMEGDRDDKASWESQFPIDRTSFTSKKFKNKHDEPSTYNYAFPFELSGVVDAFTQTEYDANNTILNDAKYIMGLFIEKDKDGKVVDPNTKYVTIVNRRTWPVYYVANSTGAITAVKQHPDPNSSEDMLGPVDCRRLSFRINKSVVDPNNQYQYFSIVDLKTGKEKLVKYGETVGGIPVDNFEVDFEPGEGTLIKISPAYSIAAGMTSEMGMAYNNGHRIAEIGNPLPTARKKIMVWENNGSIEFRITNTPTSQTPLENVFDPTTSSGTIATKSGNVVCQNPSVAANGSDVVVVYSTENTTNHARQVIACWGQLSGGAINWSAIQPITLDLDVPKDFLGQPDQLVTPVVTPGANGFLCAWSTSDNGNNIPPGHKIQVAYITLDQGNITLPLPQPAPPVIQNEPTLISEIFPTLASRNEATATSTHERFHLAWEGVFNNDESQIYYTRYDQDQNGNWTNIPIERVTKLVSGCKHHHPSIAVHNDRIVDVSGGYVHVDGEPIVTWEREELLYGDPTARMGQSGIPVPLPIPTALGRSVMVRSRDLGNWQRIHAISPKANNIPLPQILPSNTMIFFPYPQQIGVYSYWVTYMKQAPQEVGVTQFIPKQNINKSIFASYKLPELGLYPHLTLRYEPETGNPAPSLLNTLAFRGVNKFIDDAGKETYHARVTAPVVDGILKPVKGVSAIKLNAVNAEKCKNKFTFSVGNPNLRPAIWCTGCPDTIYFNIGTGKPIWFNNYDITDTRPGYYGESDTTIYHWPRTEDSIRTEDFEYSVGDTLSFDRIFFMEDTAWVKTLINDSTLSNINYSVLLKDSASGQTIATLDQITIDTASIDIAVKRFGEDNITSVSAFLPPMPPPTSFYMPQGPGRKVQWVANQIAPSGKAYITVHASKDEDMPVVLSQEHGEYDNFDVIIPTIDTALFKQAGQQPISNSAPSTPVTLTINPNPFEGSTRVTVETVKDVPLSVQVYNVLGGLVADLYSSMSTQTHYEFTLDSKTIRPGTYFIRAQAGNGIVTKKVQFVK